MIEITITGIEETRRMLEGAPKQVAARGLLKALRAGARVIEVELDARTPEGAQDTLRAARVTEVEIDADDRGGAAAIGFGSMGNVANFLEYGHRMVGHQPMNKFEGIVQPHPFMRPAAAAAADRAVDAFAAALVDELKGDLFDA